MAETKDNILEMISDHLEATKKKAPRTVIIFPDFLKALANAVQNGNWDNKKLDEVFNDKVVDVFKNHIQKISQGEDEKNLKEEIKKFRQDTLSEFVKKCADSIAKAKINLKENEKNEKEKKDRIDKIAKILKHEYDSYAGFQGTFWQKYISPYWKNFVNAFTKDKEETAETLAKKAK